MPSMIKTLSADAQMSSASAFAQKAAEVYMLHIYKYVLHINISSQIRFTYFQYSCPTKRHEYNHPNQQPDAFQFNEDTLKMNLKQE
jgi:hypothetical protein